MKSMSPVGKHHQSERIPQDVLDRAQKAGVSDLDWYAGRLDISGTSTTQGNPPSQARDAHAAWKGVRDKRRAKRKNRRRATLVKLMGLLRRQPAPGRHAD